MGGIWKPTKLQRLFGVEAGPLVGGQVVQLADIFAGTHPMSQTFGANPRLYAPYGFKGHEGLDFACNSGTEIWSAIDGVVIRAGIVADFRAYGTFVEVWDDVQRVATVYAHLQQVLVNVGERVHARQPIGISDNTGNSTGPHLHFGVCQTDANGYRLNRTNGFGGWLNPTEPPSGAWDGTNLAFHWTFTNQRWTPTPVDPCQTWKDQVAALSAVNATLSSRIASALSAKADIATALTKIA